MSGWTIATIERDDDYTEGDTLPQALDERFDHADVVGGRIRLLAWGYGQGGPVATALDEHTSSWERAVLMNCNDTTDSGDGTCYESVNGSAEGIESANGVESARGHDAAKELCRTYRTGTH